MKLTNSQRFTYRLYDNHKEKILLYLRLQAAKRLYQEKVHGVEHSVYTYTQKDHQRDIVRNLEAELSDYRISIQKLQKINRNIKKAQSRKELPKNLDFLTKYFIKLFFEDSKIAKFRGIKPTSEQLEKYKKYKIFRRQTSMGALDLRTQSKILARRLTRLHNVFYPNSDNPGVFINKVLDRLETDEHIIEKLVNKAVQINPKFDYFAKI